MISFQYLTVALSTAAIPTEVMPGPAHVGLWLVGLLAVCCAALWFLGESPEVHSAVGHKARTRVAGVGLGHRIRSLGTFGHRPIFSHQK